MTVGLAVVLAATLLPTARSEAETLPSPVAPAAAVVPGPQPVADPDLVRSADPDLAPQIVGGGPASQVPAQAVALVLFNEPKASCTGVLVAPQWVLTAAHCLVRNAGTRAPLNDISTYRIFVGVAPGAQVTTVAARNATQLVLSDGYGVRNSAEDVPGYRSQDTGLWVAGTPNLPNDLALDDFGLIQLDTPVAGVTPLPLAVDDSLYQWGRRVWATGWGLTSGSATVIPDVLQEVQMTVQNTTFCEVSWREYFSAVSNVCYGDENVATCSGDSGGPILSRDERGQWWIVAVVTGGQRGCPPGRPYVGVRGAFMANLVASVTGVPQFGRAGESLNPMVPVRIVDSRVFDTSRTPPVATGLGVDYIPPTVGDPRVLGIFKPVPTLPAGFVVRRPLFAPGSYQVPGLPTGGGLAGVVLNVTVDQPAGPGFLTVYPCADGRPSTSNLNYVGGQTVANLVISKVDRNGDVCFLTSNQTSLIVDLVGWLGAAGTDRSLVSATPARLLDTRLSGGRLVGGVASAPLEVTGVGKAPVGAAGVVLNLTSTNPSGIGFVTAWPCDAPRPNASSLNPIPGRDVANAAVVKTAADGTVCFYSSVATDLVVDLNGWFVAGGGTVKSLTPARVVDTRTANAPLAANVAREVVVAGVGGVPGTGVDSVLLNVTIVGPAANGFAVVFPCGATPPASNLNFALGQTVPNAVVAKVTDGKVCVLANQPAHLVVDVTGYVRSPV